MMVRHFDSCRAATRCGLMYKKIQMVSGGVLVAHHWLRLTLTGISESPWMRPVPTVQLWSNFQSKQQQFNKYQSTLNRSLMFHTSNFILQLQVESHQLQWSHSALCLHGQGTQLSSGLHLGLSAWPGKYMADFPNPRLTLLTFNLVLMELVTEKPQDNLYDWYVQLQMSVEKKVKDS